MCATPGANPREWRPSTPEAARFARGRAGRAAVQRPAGELLLVSRISRARLEYVAEMGDLRLAEAAAVLHVSTETLRSWERRFGYPHSVPGAAGQRHYAHREVIALRDTLEAGLSVAAAINKARRRCSERPSRR